MNGYNEELKSVESDNEHQKDLPLWWRICRRCDHMMTELYADKCKHEDLCVLGKPFCILSSLERSCKEPLPRKQRLSDDLSRPRGLICSEPTWKDPLLVYGAIALVICVLAALFG
jgi:hypothetical protein